MSNATIKKTYSPNEFVPVPVYTVYSGTASAVRRTENSRKAVAIGSEYGMGIVVACEPSGHQFFPFAVTIEIDGVRPSKTFDRYQDAVEFAKTV